MSWNEKVHLLLRDLPQSVLDETWRQRCVRLIDFTNLHTTDDEEDIARFCLKAHTPYGDVAGVCVYPQYVQLAADQFAGSSIKAITVANFPEGTSSIETVLSEINHALVAGAEEIDVVFPYQSYLANHKEDAREFVATCKAACGNKILKIILETSALHDLTIIANAALDVLMAGADFIKTSTGKLATGASLEAAAVMLSVVRDLQAEKPHVGVKVSGGIHRLTDAALYLSLAEKIFNEAWLTPDHFRIGASRLLEAIVKG